jgi:hypothetical protein
MKNSISGGIIVLAVALLAPQIVQAQGMMTFLSNLDQASVGSLAVGSDSWLATGFGTGTNAGGYTLNSIQLGMANASGNPTNFTVMIYSAGFARGPFPGTNLDTLVGSLNPTTVNVFTFTDVSNLMLSPGTDYFIVLTAGTTVTNGAYDWNYENASSYNPSGDWTNFGSIWTSKNGSTYPPWTPTAGNPQFAINATAIPEPGVLSLFGLGGLGALLPGLRRGKHFLPQNRG